ncbi:MAG: tRNA lysidine(34) synthetase TilS, partial [Hoeflea sp.]|nr:tRNA lysidine(34) synthetase TilS [Hoeflea sp.]
MPAPDPLAQMPSGLEKCLSEFLSQVTDHRPLGVAVSGGSDSLGLLYGLARLVAPGRLFALTVDHGLRAGSAEEARQVKAHCRRLGVCHQTLHWEGGPPPTGLQAAARSARYRLLASAAARLGLAAVLTGHTRDDQQETLAMRRARSPSGGAGLAGIPRATLFEERMWVLRPLLGLTRAEIRGFLRQARVDWIEDPSNSDARFERVRVRGLLTQSPADAAAPDGVSTAAGRLSLARRVAIHIDENCSWNADDMVLLRWRPEEDPVLLAAVIEALIELCGGAGRPPDRRGKATLAEALRLWAASPGDRGDRSLTLGRALVRLTNGDLEIRRERRGIEKASLAPGACCVWDGRYRIRNLDRNSPLELGGGGQNGVSPSFGRYLDGTVREWVSANGVEGGFLCRR